MEHVFIPFAALYGYTGVISLVCLLDRNEFANLFVKQRVGSSHFHLPIWGRNLNIVNMFIWAYVRQPRAVNPRYYSFERRFEIAHSLIWITNCRKGTSPKNSQYEFSLSWNSSVTEEFTIWVFAILVFFCNRRIHNMSFRHLGILQ
jgi:hypothetical protein